MTRMGTWGLRMFATVVLAGAAGCGPSGPSEASSNPGARDPRQRSPADVGWFADVTVRLGVDFVRSAGTNYFMPDQIGSGVALLDVDRDGRLDLYLVQNGGPKSDARNRLYRQKADGTFRDASRDSGLDVAGPGMGAIAGDVNNDGLADVALNEYGATRLFVNLGEGRFQEVTREAGLDNPRWAAPASFLDFDRDGWLDLVVGNYVDYDPTQVCHDVQGRQEFCAPAAYAATVTRLWRNGTTVRGGSPRFEDVTERSGLIKAPGVALGLVCADFDGDGWPDIFCSDDGRPNRLFINRRDGTFVEEAVSRGVALNGMGRTAGNMGVAYGDVDGDGLGDLFITHLAEEFHSLFRQDRRGLYSDVVAQAGLQAGGWRGTGFGTVLSDVDRDGALDLLIVNGLVQLATPGQKPVLPGVSAWWARYAQRPQVFANLGAGKFTDVSDRNPAMCGLAGVGRSLAVGDLDGDGAQDMVVGNTDGPVRILRNVAPARGSWLTLSLVDPKAGGRDMIGAEAIVTTGERRRWGVLQPSMSYLASHEPVIHFGFASGEEVRGVEVLWPEGERERFVVGALNRRVVLAKGSGEGVAR